MPIKFRCKYCQQFLGISKSRAGAVVDCPQCGRSVRVPELDGRTRKLPTTTPPGGDDSLISALSELSSLGEVRVQPPSTIQSNPPIPVSQPVAYGRDVDKPEPVLNDRPAVNAATEWSDSSELEYSDDPIALSDSLAELASIDFDQDPGVVSDELLQDMRSARQQSAWISNAAIFLSLFTLLIGLVGGWWLTKSGLIKVDLPFDNSVSSSDSGQLLGATIADPALGVVAAEHVLQGTIQYESTTGQLLPDDGATILLLPRERKGTLLFDARSLQQPAGHPDRDATLAALNSLGVKVAWANQAGLYAVAHEAQAACRMVVVSQHSQRPTDLPIPQNVDQVLRSYFQSPNHVCGQLAVQIVDVEDSSTLDFQFHPQQ